MNNGEQIRRCHRIVVIDDDAVLVHVICEILRDAGYIAAGYTDGLLAENEMFAQETDLVILDWRIRGVGGNELFHHLRQNPLTARTPILVCSADPRIADHANEIKQIGGDVLQKPFDIEDLVQKTHRLIEGVTEGSGS